MALMVARFGDAVDLVHGRQKGADKDAAMARFAAEVGVDVPEATVMVIEHADGFGLSKRRQSVSSRGGSATDLLALIRRHRPRSLVLPQGPFID
jgi:ATP-dependent DNA helicase RecG